MFEARLVTLPPGLEGAPSEASVGGGGPVVLPPNLGHVHHVGDGAVAGDGTLGLIPAVTGWSRVLGFWSEDIFVVPGLLNITQQSSPSPRLTAVLSITCNIIIFGWTPATLQYQERPDNSQVTVKVLRLTDL